MSLSAYNFYDFVSFPDKEIRQKAKAEFFDIIKLRFDMEKYNTNHPDEDKVFNLGEFDVIRKIKQADIDRRNGFSEVIRRMNNQLSIADITLLSLYGYYEKMRSYAQTDECEKYLITEIIFRKECCRACFEYFSIKEKYKAIVRDLYKLSKDSTKRDEDFFIELSKINNPYIKDFIGKCKALSQSQNYKEVIKIRNNEMLLCN